MPGASRTTGLERALRAVGKYLEPGPAIELLLVGGAAAMVTGLLPPSRTTLDCDVMVYDPDAAGPAVELAAEQAAAEMGLSRDWLNSKA